MHQEEKPQNQANVFMSTTLIDVHSITTVKIKIATNGMQEIISQFITVHGRIWWLVPCQMRPQWGTSAKLR
jgi:hypothetical protein